MLPSFWVYRMTLPIVSASMLCRIPRRPRSINEIEKNAQHTKKAACWEYEKGIFPRDKYSNYKSKVMEGVHGAPCSLISFQNLQQLIIIYSSTRVRRGVFDFVLDRFVKWIEIPVAAEYFLSDFPDTSLSIACLQQLLRVLCKV